MTNEQQKLIDDLRELRDAGKLHSNDALVLLEIIDELELELYNLSRDVLVPQPPPSGIIGMPEAIRIQDNESLIPKERDFPGRRPDHEC